MCICMSLCMKTPIPPRGSEAPPARGSPRQKIIVFYWLNLGMCIYFYIYMLNV